MKAIMNRREFSRHIGVGVTIVLCTMSVAKASEATDTAIARYTWWLAAATLVLAVATIGLLILAIRQGRDTAKALAATEKAIKLDLQRERAYVFVESMGHTAMKWRNGEDQFMWTLRIVNHGQTPAIIESIKAAATVSNRRPWQSDWERGLERANGKTEPLDPQEEWGEMQLQPTALVLASGASSEPITCISDRPFQMNGVPNVALQTVLQGNQRMFWVSGRVTYKDVFDVEHKTAFCFVLDPRSTEKVSAFEDKELKAKLNLRT